MMLEYNQKKTMSLCNTAHGRSMYKLKGSVLRLRAILPWYGQWHGYGQNLVIVLDGVFLLNFV
jgi:hypothetical protein